MNVIVDGLMINYQKTGHGKQLLMIHGWGDSAKTFAPLADLLKDDFQIIAVDLPGFGASQAPDEVWGTKDYASFAEKLISKLGLKPYAVAGHSFGGAVAMEMASGNPNFNRLVLLASAGVRNKRTAKSGVLKLAAKAAKPALLAVPSRKRGGLKRRLYSSIGSDAMLLPHMEAIYRKIVAEDIRPAAEHIHLPVLLVYGIKDRATPPADGLVLHKLIKDSDLQIVESGHFLHQQAAGQVAAIIREFLRGGDV